MMSAVACGTIRIVLTSAVITKITRTIKTMYPMIWPTEGLSTSVLLGRSGPHDPEVVGPVASPAPGGPAAHATVGLGVSGDVPASPPAYSGATTAVAPSIRTTCTSVPSGRVGDPGRPSSCSRAVQTSPISLMRPPDSVTGTTTTARRP